jgi:hypothetical protein
MEMETLILRWQILSSNNVSILTNDGSGNFTLKGNVGVGSDPRGLSFGDIDGDGDLDIAVANHYSNNVSILANDGSGNFTLKGECWGGKCSSGYIIWRYRWRWRP